MRITCNLGAIAITYLRMVCHYTKTQAVIFDKPLMFGIN